MSVVTLESVRPHDVKGVFVSFVYLSAFTSQCLYRSSRSITQMIVWKLFTKSHTSALRKCEVNYKCNLCDGLESIQTDL